eukprot:10730-Amphidinium_carterae.1
MSGRREASGVMGVGQWPVCLAGARAWGGSPCWLYDTQAKPQKSLFSKSLYPFLFLKLRALLAVVEQCLLGFQWQLFQSLALLTSLMLDQAAHGQHFEAKCCHASSVNN